MMSATGRPSTSAPCRPSMRTTSRSETMPATSPCAPTTTTAPMLRVVSSASRPVTVVVVVTVATALPLLRRMSEIRMADSRVTEVTPDYGATARGGSGSPQTGE